MRVHAISSSVSQHSTSSSRVPRGYTKSHLNFSNEVNRYQRKASGVTAIVPSTVTLRVIMARPVVKGTKLIATPIDPVCSYSYMFLETILIPITGSFCEYLCSTRNRSC